jgi:hypothetical protein
LAGAAIGKHNGDTGAGALLGGAVGLVTGALVGNSMDETARVQAYQQQAYQQQMHQMQQLSRAVSANDAITMTRNGLSDDVIANHIRENGVQRKLEVSEVIMLHKNGVSEAVITAMQNAPVGRPAVAAAPPVVYQARPVIVEQRYYAPPPPYWYGPRPYPVYRYHHHPGPSPHIHWGISFGR